MTDNAYHDEITRLKKQAADDRDRIADLEGRLAAAISYQKHAEAELASARREVEERSRVAGGERWNPVNVETLDVFAKREGRMALQSIAGGDLRLASQVSLAVTLACALAALLILLAVGIPTW